MKSIGTTDVLHHKLKRFCERHGLGLGEYISTSLAYFEKQGINPSTHVSPAGEMSKLIKEITQVVDIIRKQESELLRPMVSAVSASEARIEKSVQEVATAKHLAQVASSIDASIKDLFKLITRLEEEGNKSRSHTEKLLQEQHEKQLAYLTEIVRFLDKRDKDSVVNKVVSFFKKSL